jgi:hypothetical protein
VARPLPRLSGVPALPLTEASVKTRAGGPSDEPEDYALDIWAGVVPVTSGFGEPEPDAVLRTGIETPPHIVKRDQLPQHGSAARLATHDG